MDLRFHQFGERKKERKKERKSSAKEKERKKEKKTTERKKERKLADGRYGEGARIPRGCQGE